MVSLRLRSTIVSHRFNCFFWNQSRIPCHKILISIQVSSSNLIGYWNFSFFWKYNTVKNILKLIITRINSSQKFNITWVQARISGYHNFAFHNFRVLINIIWTITNKNFSFLQNIVFIYNSH